MWATGDILLRAEINLELRTAKQTWEAALFLADSGTEMTTMPAAEAKRLGVPFPGAAVRGLVHHQTGLPIRSGLLRLRVMGMDATEYIIPCYFLGDPDAAAPPLTQRQSPRSLLGLTGVIDKLRLSFDGDPAPGAPHGSLVIEKK